MNALFRIQNILTAWQGDAVLCGSSVNITSGIRGEFAAFGSNTSPGNPNLLCSKSGSQHNLAFFFCNSLLQIFREINNSITSLTLRGQNSARVLNGIILKFDIKQFLCKAWKAGSSVVSSFRSVTLRFTCRGRFWDQRSNYAEKRQQHGFLRKVIVLRLLQSS